MAQLGEGSLTKPEDPGSNPVIGNFYLNIYLLLTVCRKDENKEKEAGNGPFKKRSIAVKYLPELGVQAASLRCSRDWESSPPQCRRGLWPRAQQLCVGIPFPSAIAQLPTAVVTMCAPAADSDANDADRET